MNKKLMTAGAAALVAVITGCALFAPKTYDGVDLEPGDFSADDLHEPACVRSVSGDPIVVVDKDGNELYKNYQTRPNIQDLSVGNLGTDAYKITLNVTDTFGQTTEKTYESEAYAAAEEPTDEPTEPTNGLNTPAIIGIAAGAVVLVGAVIGIVAGANAKKKKAAKAETTEESEKTED